MSVEATPDVAATAGVGDTEPIAEHVDPEQVYESRDADGAGTRFDLGDDIP